MSVEQPSNTLNSATEKLLAWYSRHRVWFWTVLFPTLITAVYFFAIASDQYESEAHFLVRSSQGQQAPATGLGQALSLVGGSAGSNDASSVVDYLNSHDAVSELQKRINIAAMFSKRGIDPISRLWPADPTPETLDRFFSRQVDVELSTETGITSLRVRGFSPQDSYKIINTLLALGEERVNQMNKRSYASSLGVAEQQLAGAEMAVAKIQGSLTNFRHGGDINPQATGQARTMMVSQLEGQLAQTRAQEAALASTLNANSPQLVALHQRVQALQAQVNREKARLATGTGNVATGLGTYEGLQLRQEFAAKRYEAAAAALEKARTDASRQQLFVVRVVDPNLPVRALYPKRIKIIGTVFLVLLLSYGIGWLIVAGVREHAA